MSLNTASITTTINTAIANQMNFSVQIISVTDLTVLESVKTYIIDLNQVKALVVLIVPLNNCVDLFYSVPDDMKFTVPMNHYNKCYKCDNRMVYVGYVDVPQYSTLFKYPDQLLTEILNELKVQNIYQDDESDDEYYCLNDLVD